MRTEIKNCNGCHQKLPIVNRRYGLCTGCNQDRIERHREFLGIESVEKIVEGTAIQSAFVKQHKNKPTGVSLPELTKLLDILFSRWVKKVNTDQYGMVTCYTCDDRHPVFEIENGHFISRNHMATRWHEDNCRPQCKDCNDFKEGCHDKFRERLVSEIGQNRVECLEYDAKHEKKFSIDELQIMINHYKFLIDENKR
jgi:hypothetical protein